LPFFSRKATPGVRDIRRCHLGKAGEIKRRMRKMEICKGNGRNIKGK
jgi:hypothetical protein